MSRGFRWPPTIGTRGGVELLGDTNSGRSRGLKQIIYVALLGGDCTDPYVKQEKIGVSSSAFMIGNDETTGRIKAEVEQIFRPLERAGRARLIRVSFPENPQNQEAITVDVTYINLELQQEDAISFAKG